MGKPEHKRNVHHFRLVLNPLASGSMLVEKSKLNLQIFGAPLQEQVDSSEWTLRRRRSGCLDKKI